MLEVVFDEGWFIWATILGACLVFIAIKGIKLGVDAYRANKRRKQNLSDFHNDLVKQFQIDSSDDNEPTKVKIEKALTTILQRYPRDPEFLRKFDPCRYEFCNVRMYKYARVVLGIMPDDFNYIKGKKLKVIPQGWPNVDSCTRAFTLKWPGGAIYCYPYFYIHESADSIKLCDWSSITFSHTKGRPYDHTYLHARIDGFPDRRYRYNPAIPVYKYSCLSIHMNNEVVNMVLHGECAAENTANIFKSFQNAINALGNSSSTESVCNQ